MYDEKLNVQIFKIEKSTLTFTLIGMQTETMSRSATARLPKNRFVCPFSSFDLEIATIISL